MWIIVSRNKLDINIWFNGCLLLDDSGSNARMKGFGSVHCKPSNHDDELRCRVHCMKKDFRTGRCEEFEGEDMCRCLV